MAIQISVVIPNYNGAKLLSKNLPNVVKNLPDCEIIIVDDASIDNSLEILKKDFRKIKVIKHSQNTGFAQSANDGVAAATGKLVVLLNSDVSPRNNFLKRVTGHFKNPRNFAVGFADFSHENGQIIKRGRGGAVFKQGFVSHFAQKPIFGETLWVSGGSGIFDKKKFQELGGFDKVFAPFYWEDIDLSFRAWRSGFICRYDPGAQVDHFHQEGAVKKTKSPFLVKTVSYKNQFLFVWKNISDTLWLIQHLLWLPYHFIKAMITPDPAFFVGFAWALFQLPKLIFDYSLFTIHYPFSDREVLFKFAKS